MAEAYDFVIVGAGSAGAIIASRLSEDPNFRVCLIEAGGRPPIESRVPAMCPPLQKNPVTDWCLPAADAGAIGKGLVGGRMTQPRGKMLGGSSGINYMAYVRGHPGDFDDWARRGADGWSYQEVLPYFKKSEALQPSDHLVIDEGAHKQQGPLGVSTREPPLPGALNFVDACVKAGLPKIDYNGRDRGGQQGGCSLFQMTIKGGVRQSTYEAFIKGEVEDRPNLRIITGAYVTRLVLDGTAAKGVEYNLGFGGTRVALASRETIVCAGAIGSPQLLMLSGIGPRDDLVAKGVGCAVDSPHVGKHLKDHLMHHYVCEAPGSGVPMAEFGLSLGPSALRAPAGPLPENPADDDKMSDELKAVKEEAERRMKVYAETGQGLMTSSIYDAVAFTSTGLGDLHTHDMQLAGFFCGYNPDIWRDVLGFDISAYFADAEQQLAPEKESIILIANPVQPHSEGDITLASGKPSDPPIVRYNYMTDPHDVKVMRAGQRRVLDIYRNFKGIGKINVPPHLAAAHGWKESDGYNFSDAMLDDWARHYSVTTYHQVSTCRIARSVAGADGGVVDARLRVHGATGLRVCDASVMPNIVSGNTNAASMMIGEKAAEIIAAAHRVRIREFVGAAPGAKM